MSGRRPRSRELCDAVSSALTKDGRVAKMFGSDYGMRTVEKEGFVAMLR